MKTSFVSIQLTILAGLFLTALPATAQELPPDAQKSAAAVRERLAKMGPREGQILHQAGGGVATTFPNHHMIVVRYRQFPVAFALPEGLRASNLFAVDGRTWKIEHLKDFKALEAFFRANQPPVKSDTDARAILAAWLTLAQEFHQDGMLKFDVLEKEFTVADDRSKAGGRAVVMQGGNGELAAELTFDKDGKLATAVEKASLRQGPRPICQATKLLDADPIVRRIAEQDLIIMGLSARDYIMEQRRLAAPDLRRAIDRVWERIEKNGW